MNQIIFLGTPYIQSELEKSLHHFEDIHIIQEEKKDSNKPVLYLYCGNCEEDKNKYSRIFLSELVEKQLVLPVVKDPSLFNAYIPEELGSINAIIIPSGNEVNKLKNRVLEWFGKIEANRKIFISYKRSDSTVLAQQLYNALIKAHYIPFLDSYSIDSGVAFQEYLLHELSDSAVFLFINTPNYDMSKFTMEELNAANQLQLGVIEIYTNGAKHYKEAEFAEVFNLDGNIDYNKECDDNTIRSILDFIEKTRANLFEFKFKAIIDQIRIKNKDKSLCVDSNRICYTGPNGACYYPILHNPISSDFQKAEDKMSKQKNTNKYLVFNGLHCRKDIKEHILWLNKSLPIKAIDINE